MESQKFSNKNSIPASKQVIEYLKRNLSMKNYVSMFVAGSLPERIIPKSDLDVFIVMKGWRKEKLLENLSKIMDKFLQIYPKVTYSFFRGPIKYKDKGLIHFVLFTEEKQSNPYNDLEFRNDLRQVLKSLLKSAIVIKGKSLKEMTKGINLSDKQALESNIEKIKKKFRALKKKNCIKYKEWKKKNGRWVFTPTYKYPSKWFRRYLFHYFNKNLP